MVDEVATGDLELADALSLLPAAHAEGSTEKRGAGDGSARPCGGTGEDHGGGVGIGASPATLDELMEELGIARE